jgi:hypothetical protein
MKTMRLSALLATAALLGAAGPSETGQLPAGWIKAGSKPAEYEMAVDTTGCRSGRACAFIKGKGAEPDGFGTLMQTFAAGDYRGMRLRLSGYVKAEGIQDWAGLWMRVDGPARGRDQVLAFDNMQDRPIKGSSDWTRYEIVLDVPPESVDIAFGILLSGAGQAWLDDLSFEVVDEDVGVTGAAPQVVAPRPRNLDFEG